MGDDRKHIAVYPGTFDPVTYGHLDVIERGRRIFDHLIIGVGQNPAKETLFSVHERIEMLKVLVSEIIERDQDQATVEIHAYHGLTVDFARRQRASVLLRGIRNLSDLQYEVQQAVTNRQVAGLETAFVVAGQSFAYTSSTLIKQITAMGEDLQVLASMCPPLVIERLQKKKSENPEVLRRLQETE